MSQPMILVVEDEPLIRMDIVDMVRQLGFSTLEARDADEAISTLMDEPPDIVAVLTDIDMPGSMDGLRLARMVRDRWPPCKLLIVSGRHQLTENDLPEGARFLPKPLQRGKLRSELNSLGLAIRH